MKNDFKINSVKDEKWVLQNVWLTSFGHNSNANANVFLADCDRSNMYPFEFSLVAIDETAADECDHEL